MNQSPSTLILMTMGSGHANMAPFENQAFIQSKSCSRNQHNRHDYLPPQISPDLWTGSGKKINYNLYNYFLNKD